MKTDCPSSIWRTDFAGESLVRDVSAALPEGSTILHVDKSNRGGLAAMWFIFPSENEDRIEERKFRTFGTGHPVPPGYEYRGSTYDGRELVWHVFERIDS